MGNLDPHFVLSPLIFLPNAQRTLVISQWLVCLLKFLGYIFLGMKTILRLMLASTLGCQRVFLSKS